MCEKLKQCTKCNYWKPISDFYSSGGKCKECKKSAQREYNAKHRVPKSIHEDGGYLSTGQKYCRTCKELKSVEEFYFSSSRTLKNGNTVRYRAPSCKKCEEERAKKIWNLLTPQERQYKSRQYDKAKKAAYGKKHKEENKEYYRWWFREHYKEKRKNDLYFKLTENLRRRFRESLAGKHKSNSVIDLIGCTLDELKIYLESKFKNGMNWNNYGLWKRGMPMTWHIDHIRPCSSFDLSDPEQQRQCFHYTNLQPLWANENFAKSDKYIE